MDNTEARIRTLENKIKKLENKLSSLDGIQQISANGTLSDIILAVNKITNSLKRKR